MPEALDSQISLPKRNEQRPSFRPFLQCESQDQVVDLEARLIQLIVGDLFFKARRYDNMATAYYCGSAPMARTEPVMIEKWSNRVELDHDAAKRFISVNPAAQVLDHVIRGDECRSIVGDPSKPHAQGINVILRGDGMIQREIEDIVFELAAMVEGIAREEDEPDYDTKVAARLDQDQTPGMIADFQLLGGEDGDLKVLSIGSIVNRRAGDLLFSDLTPN